MRCTVDVTRARYCFLAPCLTVAIALTHVQGATGQAPDAALKAIAGKEKKPHDQTTIVSPPLSAAESQTLLGKIQAIRRALLATPALSELRGYDWATHARIRGEAGRLVTASLGVIAYPYFFNGRTNRAESSAEGAPFTISLNDPDVVLGNGTYLVDQDARFTFAPASAGMLDGYPAYFEGERFVVIMKDQRPLFVPVTEQQYLDRRIAQERKSFAELTASLQGLADSPAKQTAG